MCAPELACVGIMEKIVTSKPHLSKTQIELLRLVNLGLSNQEIAARLMITLGTTKWHLHRIFRELEVRNRTAAAAKARELGLVESEQSDATDP